VGYSCAAQPPTSSPILRCPAAGSLSCSHRLNGAPGRSTVVHPVTLPQPKRLPYPDATHYELLTLAQLFMFTLVSLHTPNTLISKESRKRREERVTLKASHFGVRYRDKFKVLKKLLGFPLKKVMARALNGSCWRCS
jgi:hypothetical protein